MFNFIFGRKKQKLDWGRAPIIPDGNRIYAVGDIHGRIDLLTDIRRKISEDIRSFGGSENNTVVYLGDYIDRGLDSKETLDTLIKVPIDNAESVFLKGNHEEMLLIFLDDASIGPTWLSYGGDAFLYSYKIEMPVGFSKKEKFNKIQERLKETLPAQHLDFIRSLELSYELGDYFFVHAGILPGKPLSKQTPRDMLWIGEEFTMDQSVHEKRIIHGHTVTKSPEVRHNRIGIDAGAVYGGKLYCLVLEGDKGKFLSSQIEHNQEF